MALFRFEWRALRRHPRFVLTVLAVLAPTAAAAACLLVVLAASTGAFWPHPDRERLVVVWEQTASLGATRTLANPVNAMDWMAGSTLVDEWAHMTTSRVPVGRADTVERTAVARVTPSMFRLLGVAPAMGRALLDEDVTSGGVVVISHRQWIRMGGDSDVLGIPIVIDGLAHTIVGVLPAEFSLPFVTADLTAPITPDVWLPLAPPAPGTSRVGRFMLVLARLGKRVTADQAQAELARIAADLGRDHPVTNRETTVVLSRLIDDVTAPARRAVQPLLAGVAIIMIVAAANVMQLSLSRAIGRARDLSTLIAIGATRAAVIRTMSSEAVTGGLVAGLVAAPMAYLWASQLAGSREFAAVAYAPALPWLSAIAALALASIVGVAVGMAAALASLRGWSVIGRSARRVSRTGRWQAALSAGQIACSLALLFGGGLLGARYLTLLATDPGFDREGPIVARVFMPAVSHRAVAPRVAFIDQMRAALVADGRVAAAGFMDAMPLADRQMRASMAIVGEADPTELPVAVGVVTPGFFEAAGMRVLAGRDFAVSDAADGPPVVVVNAAFAERFLAGRDPTRSRLRMGFAPGVEQEVIGVVGDIRHASLAGPAPPTVFAAYAQFTLASQLALFVRPVSPALAPELARTLPDVARALSPGVLIYDVRPASALLSGSLALLRANVSTAAAFAFAALGLALAAVYATSDLWVRTRSKELALRLAIGAPHEAVRRLVRRQVLMVAGLGVSVGVPLAWLVARALRDQISEPAPMAWLSLGGLAAVLLGCALVGADGPARRAARLDPLSLLKGD